MPRVQTRRCQRCLAGEPCEFQHGSKTGYNYHNCRCDVCVAGNTARVAAYRAENPELIRQHRRKSYYADVERSRAQLRASRRRHRQRRQADCRAYYEANRETVLEHQREYYAGYYTRQRGYVNDRNRRGYARRQGVGPSAVRRRWMSAEDSIVLRDDLMVLEMAFMLGRTYAAVQSRRRTLALKR